MYFLWRHHLPPYKLGNDQDSDSDWFTCCIMYAHTVWLLTLLFSLRYLSESCFGNDNKFLSPNPRVVLFFIYPTFYSLKMLFTQPFSLRCPPPPPPPPPPPRPAIKNDWPLMPVSKSSYCFVYIQANTESVYWDIFFWYKHYTSVLQNY
jgi:hypothetical protein